MESGRWIPCIRGAVIGPAGPHQKRDAQPNAYAFRRSFQTSKAACFLVKDVNRREQQAYCYSRHGQQYKDANTSRLHTDCESVHEKYTVIGFSSKNGL